MEEAEKIKGLEYRFDRQKTIYIFWFMCYHFGI